jgi:hypothetical protein
MEFVDGGHEGDIKLAYPDGLVVKTGMGEIEETCLMGEGQGMAPIDHFLAL